MSARVARIAPHCTSYRELPIERDEPEHPEASYVTMPVIGGPT